MANSGRFETTSEFVDTHQGQAVELAADINLVVRGIAKNVSEQQLMEYLHQRGLRGIKCELLTKFPNARSLTFKVTIKASDNATSRNPKTWPYGVSVTLFKERRWNKTVSTGIESTNLRQKRVRFSDDPGWLKWPQKQ